MTKSICVVGLGYIGLPTAVMFANHGIKVHGVDVNPAAVRSIQEKKLHIEETDLQERLDKAVDEGYLTASTTPQEADVFIIAVPSPINPDSKLRVCTSSDCVNRTIRKKRKSCHSRIHSTTENSRARDVTRAH